MLKLLTAAIFALFLPSVLTAQDRLSIIVSDSYDDMMVAVENAILNQGLVVDSVSHIGEMLNRTADDVGASEDIYLNASVFNFCSSILTREVLAIDPTNIAYCPYSIYVFATVTKPEQTTIGVPIYLYPEMTAVNNLLRDIILDAAKY